MEYMDHEVIQFVLTNYRTWAIVGASSNPSRPSNEVMRFLHDLGYNVVPINPNEQEILSKKSFPSLSAASQEHDIQVVDVFRKPSEAMTITQEAIAINARAIWFQLGVTNFEAASVAIKAGLMVVMDTCPKIEIPQLDLATRLWAP